MEPNRLTELIGKWLDESIAPGERQELVSLLQDPAARQLLDKVMDGELAAHLYELDTGPDIRASIHQYLDRHTLPAAGRKASPILRSAWWRFTAAAVILVAIAGSWWLLSQQHRSSSATPVHLPVALKNDIAPGHNGAVLTLGNGAQLVLDSLANGVVATQNGARVLLENGRLAYTSSSGATGEAAWNTMTTPKGRQFRLLLPDGTQAWLNAASSLRYPTAFTGPERMVEVSGEAYFEVAANPSVPFRVRIADKATVEVLGTHFNINAYPDENSTSTTLLEGKVRITATGNAGSKQSLVLLPGQQGNLGQSRLELVKAADIDKVMAWKNGFFNFDGASFSNVMRQLSRWYNIEVVYEKNIPDVEFVGKMDRNVSLSGLLKALEGFGLRFRIEGRRLIVTP